MIDESLLPVGSCVKVSKHSKLIMIAGYLPFDNKNKVMYDYIGIYTPIGIRKAKQNIDLTKDCVYFKNNDIEKIVFLGFSDNKSEFYRKYLSNIKKNFNSKEDLSLNVIKEVLRDSLPNIKSEG